MNTLPTFSLTDTMNRPHSFPANRHTLLCFVKEDCPTCRLVMPIIGELQRAFGEEMDVLPIGQDAGGNAILQEEFHLNQSPLDDSDLMVSFAFDLEFVPTIILADGQGKQMQRLIGFSKAEWQSLVGSMLQIVPGADPEIDWSAYPESMPGCGSKTLLPGIAERLEAQRAGQNLAARRIEVGDPVDPLEFLFEQGLTDGLPVVPPTEERVVHMLGGTSRPPQEIVGVVPPNMAPATVEKVAINAVMAGCKPEYLSVVLAAVEAVCAEEFNLHGVLATTHFASPILIVNGPIRNRIGMNDGINVLGQGNRANATIGRAVQLVVRNIGGGRPGGVDRATFGQPGKYTFCFAEREERSNWEPLHVERGFSAGESTVTAFAGSTPTGFVDQMARDARSLANSYGMVLAATSHPKHYFQGETVVLVPPEHVTVFAEDGWTKDQVREQIQAVTRRPVRELLPDEHCAEGIPDSMAEGLDPNRVLTKFQSKEMIILVVCGGEAGKFGAFLSGWLSGPKGSVMTTRLIRD